MAAGSKIFIFNINIYIHAWIKAHWILISPIQHITLCYLVLFIVRCFGRVNFHNEYPIRHREILFMTVMRNVQCRVNKLWEESLSKTKRNLTEIEEKLFQKTACIFQGGSWWQPNFTWGGSPYPELCAGIHL